MGKLLRFRRTREESEEAEEAWMFEGLRGLAVVIEDLDPVLVEAGLIRTDVQLHIERRLSEAGIEVSPLVALDDGVDVAALYVAIGAELHPTGAVACFLSIQVCEAASLEREPARAGGVTTWLTNGVWASTLDDLQQDVMKAVDDGLEELHAAFALGSGSGGA